MRVSVIALFIVMCFAIPSFAADGSPDGSTTIAPIRSAIAEAAFNVLDQNVGDASKAEWQTRMDQAQERRKRGVRYMFMGMGAGAVGTTLAMLSSGSPSISYDRNGYITAHTGSPGVKLGLMMGLAGGGLSAYGMYNWIVGANQVNDLDREGRSNGFLTLIPTDGGAQVAWNYSF